LNSPLSIAGVSIAVTQAGAVSQGGGQIVYSDFGTNNSFSPNGWCMTGPSSPYCGTLLTRDAAAPFTPSASFVLSSITIPLGYVGGTNGAIINLVNSGSSGLPGVVLESWTVLGLSAQPQPPVTSVTSILNPILQAGQTYFVEVQPLAADTTDRWYTNNLGLDGGLGGSIQAGWTPLSGLYAGQTLPAFSVIGVAQAAGHPAFFAGEDA
jgi:hypothetical protein